VNRLGGNEKPDVRWHDAIAEEVERLYKEHAADLHTYLRFRGADKRMAEDITHTTFIKIGSHLQKGNELPADPVPFLFKTAKNAWIDELRRPDQTRTEPVPTPPNDYHEVTGEDPFENVIALNDLKRLLGRLTPRERDVVVLQDLCDLTQAQIAEILGITAGTVGGYHSDAIQKLKGLLLVDSRGGEEGADSERR
jgi:RNA polymerase sigma factor (sigma-70 family)